MQKIVICGSLVYKNEILWFAKELRKLGAKFVIDPGFENISEDIIETCDEKERLRKFPLYKQQLPLMAVSYVNKIRKADIVYFYNRNQRLGINTTMELGIAVGLNKTIVFYEEDKNEPCRQIFCDLIINNPEDLAELVLK